LRGEDELSDSAVAADELADDRTDQCERKRDLERIGKMVPLTLWNRIGLFQRRCAAEVTAASSCLGSTSRATSSSSPLARNASMYFRIHSLLVAGAARR